MKHLRYKAEQLLIQGSHISVQVLNEFASIAIRKLKMSHAEARKVLAPIRAVCQVNLLTEQTHELGLQLSERYQLSIYDGMIAASALLAGGKTQLAEDMQDAQIIDANCEFEIHLPAGPCNSRPA